MKLYIYLALLASLLSCVESKSFDEEKASSIFCQIDFLNITNDFKSVDSLIQFGLNTAVNETEKTYYELLNIYVEDTDERAALAEPYMRKVESHPRSNYLYKTILIQSHLEKARISEALLVAYELVNIADDIEGPNSFEKAKLYQYIAFIEAQFLINSNFFRVHVSKSLEALESATCSNKYLESDLYSKLAYSYYQSEDYEKSLEYSKKSDDKIDDLIFHLNYVKTVYLNSLAKLGEKELFYKELALIEEEAKEKVPDDMMEIFRVLLCEGFLALEDYESAKRAVTDQNIKEDFPYNTFVHGEIFRVRCELAKMENDTESLKESALEIVELYEKWPEVGSKNYKQRFYAVNILMKLKEAKKEIMDLEYIQYKTSFHKLIDLKKRRNEIFINKFSQGE